MPMPDEGSYEIVPYKEIAELKRQIEELKQRESDAPSKEILKSISELTKSMNSMLQMFKSAADSIKSEEKEGETISKQLEPLTKKIDKIVSQHETIAEGMVSIADMVREIKGVQQMPPHQEPNPVFEQQRFMPKNSAPKISPPMGFERFGMPPEQELPPLTEPPLRVERIEPQGRPGFRPAPPPYNYNMPPPPNMPPLRPMAVPEMPAGPIPGIEELPQFGPLPEMQKKKGLFGLFNKK